MRKHGKIFVENLEKREGQVVDVFQKIGLYALDVICGEPFILFESDLPESTINYHSYNFLFV